MRQGLNQHDVEIIDTLRHIERKDSCSEIYEKKAKRKEYRDRRRAQGYVGPKEKKAKKKMEKLSKRSGLKGSRLFFRTAKILVRGTPMVE